MVSTFRKVRTHAGRGYYQAEVAGLRWITVPGGPPTPAVLGSDSRGIDLRKIDTAAPTAQAAGSFGRALATLHSSSAPSFGSGPPGAPDCGWIADLPMEYGTFDAFASMYAELRVEPYVRLAQQLGALDSAQTSVFEALCFALSAVTRGTESDLVGPPENPARLHGDLWSGNLLWSADDVGSPVVWLIDPAAYGGHRESDLAMLQLFGAPFLDEILRSYDEAYPLADGWQQRVALHQVYPLLVHTVLFGGGYARQAVAAAREALRLVD